MDNKEKFEQILEQNGLMVSIVHSAKGSYSTLDAMQSAYDLAIKDSLLVGCDDIENLLCEKAATLNLPKVQIERFVEGGEFVLKLMSNSTLSSRIEARIKELEFMYQHADNVNERINITTRHAELQSLLKDKGE